jgi:hypothetical protein
MNALLHILNGDIRNSVDHSLKRTVEIGEVTQETLVNWTSAVYRGKIFACKLPVIQMKIEIERVELSGEHLKCGYRFLW